jgi:hypothetical protein
LGFRAYLKDSLNIFDAFIVITSIIEKIMTTGGSSLAAM